MVMNSNILHAGINLMENENNTLIMMDNKEENRFLNKFFFLLFGALIKLLS